MAVANVTVDQAKLVMNTFATVFQNNLLSGDAVTWKQYDAEMDDRNALTVSEQVGPRYTISRTTNGVQDLSAGVQDSVFGSEQFKVQDIFGASMGWADFVKIRDIGDARESTAITNAATNLAEQIDAYVMKTAVNASFNWTGTPGNDVTAYGDVVAGYTRLKEEGVEDNDLRAFLTYGDKQSLGTNVISLASQVDQATDVYRQGFNEKIGGIPVAFTQQLPVLTVGSRAASGAAQINGPNQNVDYSAVAVSAAPGQYKTQTISVKGLTGTQTVKDGEVFTIANVYAYDNRSQTASTSRLQQFRVVGDYTASGGNIAAMRIYPAIIVPNVGTTTSNANVNTAHATVSAVPADSANITWLGTASTSYRARAVFQKQAIIVNTADLIMPATGKGMRKQLNKVPLSVRMWMDSIFATGDHRVRFDVALTANVHQRERICRINGA